MGVINNPFRYLIPIFITIIILLILFKFNNWVDERKIKEKKPKAEPEKKAESKIEVDKSVIAENKEEPKVEVIVSDSNYLYDRFVINPTNDDKIEDENKNNAFITEEELQDIRERKTEIQVGENKLTEKELLYNKIEAMKNENLALKDKILGEFNTLSKEMKLMLLENIIQNMK